MANPFTNVSSAVRPDNSRMITWELDPNIDYPRDFYTQVENSRAGGTWEVLATNIEDACYFVDTRKRNYNKRMDECYRVRLVSPMLEEEYVSDVIHAGNFKAYPFSSEAENIIKQVQKAINISGCTGVLLKKKYWGERCDWCTDFDGQQTVNEHCTKCLGTGFIGGYYTGITMPIIKDSIKTDEGQGLANIEASEIVTARCIAYPWVRYGDVWCEDGTNKRFMIAQVVPTATYKYTTLVYTVVMHRIEYTDVLHTPPADDKVIIKDLFNSSEVEYTPKTLDTVEKDSMNTWENALNEF